MREVGCRKSYVFHKNLFFDNCAGFKWFFQLFQLNRRMVDKIAFHRFGKYKYQEHHSNVIKRVIAITSTMILIYRSAGVAPINPINEISSGSRPLIP